ncbi:hypothetical protein LXA43DRAFT_1102649 [Ganoderma leucocontextum]|nr:hypothetical protein LXA43DRAFT_1102649 [Ganoderma leucocontextum]
MDWDCSNTVAFGQHLHNTTTSPSLRDGYPTPPAAAPSDHTTTANTTVARRRALKRHNRDEHTTFEDGVAIDSTLHEIPQKPYSNGIGVERDAGIRIDYWSQGFTVGMVLSGDLSEISNPDEIVLGLGGRPWSAKASFHLEVRTPSTIHVFVFTRNED